MNIACRGFCPALFFVFLVLKATGRISWGWWWVTCPLWLPLVLGAAFVSALCLIMFLSPVDSIDL